MLLHCDHFTLQNQKKSLLLLLYLLDFSKLNETESHVYPITFNKACALPYVKLCVYETGLKLRVQSTQYKDQNVCSIIS